MAPPAHSHAYRWQIPHPLWSVHQQWMQRLVVETIDTTLSLPSWLNRQGVHSPSHVSAQCSLRARPAYASSARKAVRCPFALSFVSMRSRSFILPDTETNFENLHQAPQRCRIGMDDCTFLKLHHNIQRTNPPTAKEHSCPTRCCSLA